MNTSQLPPFMQPESWQEFFNERVGSKKDLNELPSKVRALSNLQTQYMQDMLCEWSQLIEAGKTPDQAQRQYSEYLQKTFENTMRYSQDVMRVMQAPSEGGEPRGPKEHRDPPRRTASPRKTKP